MLGHCTDHRQAAIAGFPHGRTSSGARQLLAPADRECAAGADPRHAPRLSAAADGVFRLRGDRADGGRADVLDQAGSDLLDAGRSRRARRCGCRCRGPSRWCSASWSTPCRCWARSAAPTCSPAPALVAVSFVLLAGAAGNWFPGVRPDMLFVVASLLTVIGVVLQDVVADAMSTEVVPRVNADGTPRAEGRDRPRSRHGAGAGPPGAELSASSPSPASPAGWRPIVSYQTVFLCGLLIPLVSVSGALLVSLESHEQRPTDWRILGGGIAFGAFVVLLGVSRLPFSQEIVFVVSMAVVLLDAAAGWRARSRSRRGCAWSLPPSSSSRSAARRASARAIAGSPSRCWASTRRSTACCSSSAPPSPSSPSGCCRTW